MDNMNPTLSLVIAVRRSLENGQSVKTALLGLQPTIGERDLQTGVSALLARQNVEISFKSPHRAALVRLFEKGLAGEPILTHLQDFEEDVLAVCRSEMDRHLARLPFLLMIPLLLGLFPAIFLLLLGPFFDALNQSLGF